MGAVGRALEVRAAGAVAPVAEMRVAVVLAVAVVLVTAVTAPALGVLAAAMGAMVRVVAMILVMGATVPRTAAVAVAQVGLVEPEAARHVLMKAGGRPVPEARVVRPVARVVRVVTGGAVVHRAPVPIIRVALARRALRATTPAHRGRGHIPSGFQPRISRMMSQRAISIGRRVPACGRWPRTTRTG